MVLNEPFLEVIILFQVAACTFNNSNYISPSNIFKSQLQTLKIGSILLSSTSFTSYYAILTITIASSDS
jgi:hypothetical protein